MTLPDRPREAFRALIEDNQYLILSALQHGAARAAEIDALIEAPRSTTIHVLGVLRRLGLVETAEPYRNGRRNVYRITPDGLALMGLARVWINRA